MKIFNINQLKSTSRIWKEKSHNIIEMAHKCIRKHVFDTVVVSIALIRLYFEDINFLIKVFDKLLFVSNQIDWNFLWIKLILNKKSLWRDIFIARASCAIYVWSRCNTGRYWIYYTFLLVNAEPEDFGKR